MAEFEQGGAGQQGSIEFWQALSGLPYGLSSSDYVLAYLQQQAPGVPGSIADLWEYVIGDEVAYWAFQAGVPNDGKLSLADLRYLTFSKFNFVGGPTPGYGNSGYGSAGYGG